MAPINPRTHVEQRQCAGRTEFGSRCKSFVDLPLDFCKKHDPAEAERRRAASSLAGHVSAKRVRRRKRRARPPVELRTGSDIIGALEKAAGLIARGATAGDVARANALSRLAQAAVGAQKLIELEKQVDELQAQVEARGDGDA